MRIDVHAHYWTDDYLDLIVDLGNSSANMARGLGAGGDAQLDKRLKLMQRAGIDMQVLSACKAILDENAAALLGWNSAADPTLVTTWMPRWCDETALEDAPRDR